MKQQAILPSLIVSLGCMYLGTAAVQWFYKPDMASSPFPPIPHFSISFTVDSLGSFDCCGTKQKIFVKQ